jgi:hypothetical protein
MTRRVDLRADRAGVGVDFREARADARALAAPSRTAARVHDPVGPRSEVPARVEGEVESGRLTANCYHGNRAGRGRVRALPRYLFCGHRDGVIRPVERSTAQSKRRIGAMLLTRR